MNSTTKTLEAASACSEFLADPAPKPLWPLLLVVIVIGVSPFVAMTLVAMRAGPMH